VTLANKQTLSIGFNAVAHETARTILDLTLDRIQELSVLNNEEDSENETRKIMQNLVGLVSDRASNMTPRYNSPARVPALQRSLSAGAVICC